MATNSVLMREMETVPEQLVDEVIDFIRFVNRSLKNPLYLLTLCSSFML